MDSKLIDRINSLQNQINRLVDERLEALEVNEEINEAYEVPITRKQFEAGWDITAELPKGVRHLLIRIIDPLEEKEKLNCKPGNYITIKEPEEEPMKVEHQIFLKKEWLKTGHRIEVEVPQGISHVVIKVME
jgi:hypothetical protein